MGSARQVAAPLIPDNVLNRRKVGFPTPVHSWLRGPHNGWLRETLLSSRAQQRGLWNRRAVETLLASPDSPLWFERVWKILSVETWARVYLDASDPVPARHAA